MPRPGGKVPATVRRPGTNRLHSRPRGPTNYQILAGWHGAIMTNTLAFDVYGTLIDTHGIVAELAKHVGALAPEFSRMWRAKQLEYTFRRGLMQRYADFSCCTTEAFHFTCASLRVTIDPVAEADLLGAYRTLPAFPDVPEGLRRLQASAARLFAFSNGLGPEVHGLLASAGLRGFFRDIVSVDEIKSFKPSPKVYQHFLARAGATASETWLVSSNPFDVIGALSSGLRAAWIKRTPDAVFDPWDIEPTLTVSNLVELAARLPTTSAMPGPQP